MVAALAFPLIDGRLSALDLALGFDWVHWFTFVVAHRRLDIALQVLYETSGIQIVGVLLWLGLKGHARRLREMVALLVWTSLVIIVLSGLLPAESAWNYHDIGSHRRVHAFPSSLPALCGGDVARARLFVRGNGVRSLPRRSRRT